CARMDSNFDYW
nr:immunoglobulin heavy chain junction region [Macaca mulatta]MOW19039.1 immunoglobulin heavy chain junction region [Macaca mulatta]MOW19066.1 immunoglobulin heavy chain junction region [Macaca mulatta]